MLTLKKILKEARVIGLMRLPFILISLLYHNVKLRNSFIGLHYLEEDLEKLSDLSEEEINQKFGFFPHLSTKVNKGTLNWIIEHSDKRPFYSTIRDLLAVSASNTTDSETQKILQSIPTDRKDGYYRYHKLNRGKNDYWEWYLTLWHRLMPYISYMLWDNRYREHLLPLYTKFKKWYGEWIWFLWIGVGSNIYSCEAGKAFQCLNEFVLEGNKDKLKSYSKHILRVRYFMNHIFSNGIPMEGGVYGRFSLQGIIHLDQIHRKLGFQYKLIDTKFIDKYCDYLETAWSVHGGFETSGDSHIELEELESVETIIYLNKISKRKILKEILDFYKPKIHFKKLFYL